MIGNRNTFHRFEDFILKQGWGVLELIFSLYRGSHRKQLISVTSMSGPVSIISLSMRLRLYSCVCRWIHIYVPPCIIKVSQESFSFPGI